MFVLLVKVPNFKYLFHLSLLYKTQVQFYLQYCSTKLLNEFYYMKNLIDLEKNVYFQV